MQKTGFFLLPLLHNRMFCVVTKLSYIHSGLQSNMLKQLLLLFAVFGTHIYSRDTA